MDSIILAEFRSLFPLSGANSVVYGRTLPCVITYYSCSPLSKPAVTSCSASSSQRRRLHFPHFRRHVALPLAANGTANSVPAREGIYTVGDFMTGKEHLHVVRPTTTVDEALESLVETRVTGFPVVDDNWKLVGVVSDYDLLALDSISGGGEQDTNLFPVVESSWKIIDALRIPFRLKLKEKIVLAYNPLVAYSDTFNEIQKLLSKTNGKVVGDLMTPTPLVVRENTNLEDAARLLLKTKYRRLPVVDVKGKLIGIITRGDVVRAALQIKQAAEKM